MASIQKVQTAKGTVYRIRWYDASNRQKTRTFSRLEDAKRFGRNAEAAKERGEVYDSKAGRTKYAELAGEWIEMKRAKAKKEGTVNGYESLLNAHVLPTFGDLSLKMVTP